jgi:hypothetical protein
MERERKKDEGTEDEGRFSQDEPLLRADTPTEIG